MPVGQNMAPSILFAVSGLAQALAGAPAWCIVVCLAMSLGLGVAQVVFPQESGDRLKWWQNRRSYLARRRELRNSRESERSERVKRLRRSDS
ncbi:hypothetical protein [Streptomyces sp. NPDC058674]|uniref:hypothetical protein n=1 Tax=Streptomyces sp. NPDC058674 TaxID=3346592 RepID=UPI00364DCC85